MQQLFQTEAEKALSPTVIHWNYTELVSWSVSSKQRKTLKPSGE